MMEQDTIFRLLDDPPKIAECSTVSLEQLVNQYPWVPTCQLLLAKKYQLTGHDGFDDQLQKASLHAIDRQRLFTLINDPPRYINRDPEEHDHPQFERVPAEDHASQPSAKADKESDKSNEHPQTEQGKEQNDDGPVIHMKETEAYHRFMKEFGIIRESENEQPKDEKRNTEVAEDGQKSTEAETTEQDQNQPTPPNYHQANDEKPAQSPGTDSSAKSFTEWLAALNNTQKEQTAQPEKTQSSEPAPSTEDDTKKAHQTQTTSKDEMAEVSEQAEQSLAQSDDTVSGTLAYIYEKQKKYIKAIAVYEKLMLTYPEKSSFFATKIDELKQNL